MVSEQKPSYGEHSGLSAALMKVKTELPLLLADVNPPLLAFPTRQTLRFLRGKPLHLGALGTVTVTLIETALSARSWVPMKIG